MNLSGKSQKDWELRTIKSFLHGLKLKALSSSRNVLLPSYMRGADFFFWLLRTSSKKSRLEGYLKAGDIG